MVLNLIVFVRNHISFFYKQKNPGEIPMFETFFSNKKNQL